MGCFEIVKETEANGYCLYRPQLFDTVKADGTKRSRSCVAACNNRETGLFNAAPTIKRFSLRLLLVDAATCQLGLCKCNVTKSLLMWNKLFRRAIYMKVRKEMTFQKENILKLLGPLYRMPEATIHCSQTYSDNHKRALSMETTTLDACLIFRGAESVRGVRWKSGWWDNIRGHTKVRDWRVHDIGIAPKRREWGDWQRNHKIQRRGDWKKNGVGVIVLE